MNRKANVVRRATGFTLVELITVVAILGILTVLMVGAVQGIRNNIALSNTLAAFRAIDAALEAYYEDWGNRYPWIEDGSGTDDQYAKVNSVPTSPLCCRPAPVASGNNVTDEEDRAAILYAALTVKANHGPYFRGAAPPVIKKNLPASQVYWVLADGWGRMIRYKKPTDSWKPPVLESDGADEFSADEDKVRNYDVASFGKK